MQGTPHLSSSEHIALLFPGKDQLPTFITFNKSPQQRGVVGTRKGTKTLVPEEVVHLHHLQAVVVETTAPTRTMTQTTWNKTQMKRNSKILPLDNTAGHTRSRLKARRQWQRCY